MILVMHKRAWIGCNCFCFPFSAFCSGLSVLTLYVTDTGIDLKTTLATLPLALPDLIYVTLRSFTLKKSLGLLGAAARWVPPLRSGHSYAAATRSSRCN